VTGLIANVWEAIVPRQGAQRAGRTSSQIHDLLVACRRNRQITQSPDAEAEIGAEAVKVVIDMYGSQSDDLEGVRVLLETTLNVRFSPHDSSTAGLYYLWGRMYEESLVLQRNIDVDDDGDVLLEPDFADAKLLLYVNNPSDPWKIRTALASVADRIRPLRFDEI
jgi:hypothetical protein